MHAAETPAIELISARVGPARLVAEALARRSIATRAGARFRVVLAEDYRDQDLQALNLEALRTGGMWIVSGFSGKQAWIGPLFVPRRTACWACLAYRLAENGLEGGNSHAGREWRPLVEEIATAVHGCLLERKQENWEGKLWIEGQAHWVIRRPQCPACGSSRTRIPAPLRRSVAVRWPEARRLVSLVTGIVSPATEIFSEPGLSLAGACLSRRLHREASGRVVRTRRGHVFGKGRAAEDAATACLAEAAERYSSLYHGDEAVTCAKLAEVHPAVPPQSLLLFSEDQYRRREAINRRFGGFAWVPGPFDSESTVAWTSVRDLSSGRRVWVPSAYCYLGYGADFCRADSNGCAAAATLAGAILRGFLELVERDAFALWWYSAVRRPAIALGQNLTAASAAALRRLDAQGRAVHALDLTADLGIPVVAAVSAEDDGTRVMLGAGCDLNPRRAIERALLELSQTDLNARLRFPRKPAAAGDRLLRNWLRDATLGNQPFLRPLDGPSARPRNLSTGRVEGDLERCLRIAETAGLRVLALNLTRPEVGIPAARVIVPGLRHWWARFAPGRLYDVPTSLGWAPRRLDESELNPIPFFL